MEEIHTGCIQTSKSWKGLYIYLFDLLVRLVTHVTSLKCQSPMRKKINPWITRAYKLAAQGLEPRTRGL